jgi:hypothetical protein
MNVSFGSRLSGTRLVAISLSASLFLSAGMASAQQAEPAAPFTPEVLNLLLESRTQKPAGQATSQDLMEN